VQLSSVPSKTLFAETAPSSVANSDTEGVKSSVSITSVPELSVSRDEYDKLSIAISIVLLS